MNKYQKYCFQKADQSFYCFPSTWENAENARVPKTSSVYGKFDEESNSYTVFQDEDITIVKYTLAIYRGRLPQSIEAIFYEKNEKWLPVNLVNLANGAEGYKISLNFDDRISRIKVVFKNNIADDYAFDVKYVESDKQAYYDKLEQQRKDDLLAAASIKCSTGNDLVNIYFQPCCSDYLRTEITLYRDGQLLAKYKVEEESFFKSINGLAYGEYTFVLKQYGNTNNIVLESPSISFKISPPQSKIVSGKPTVTNRW